MRLFQNSGLSTLYKRRLYRLSRNDSGFESRKRRFLDDRYGGCHYLLPVDQGESSAFFTNGDDERLQRAWADENGLSSRVDLADILLAQIEGHRTEVFYNLDPIRYGGAFVRRLPGCVKKTLCWRAAPSAGLDLTGYDALVCNFPGILASYHQAGLRAAYLAPAYDPEMEGHCATERPIDVLFIGGYSRHHARRAKVLEAAAALADRREVQFYLDTSRITRLAESPLGWLPTLGRHRRPLAIRAVASGPVYGRDLYRLMGQAKVVLNGAVDMAGGDRGNMRCFEAMGCGTLLVSDAGNYPDGFVPGRNFAAYQDETDVVSVIESQLNDWVRGSTMANEGKHMVKTEYSKSRQWARFVEILSEV